jgi:uncharacterized protein YndB with AHSA1/START domain
MRKVEVAITINARPQEVIRAFVDDAMLRKWWKTERTFIEKKVGGVYTLAWNISEHGFGYVSSGIIGQFVPDSTLVIENFVYLNPSKPLLGPMKLTILATEESGQTSLYLCQDGYQDSADWDWYYETVNQAWPEVVLTLKEYLETSAFETDHF